MRLEKVIEDNYDSSFKLAAALAQIRDQKLYRKEFDTWEEYCKERWQYSRSYCLRLAQVNGVMTDLKQLPDAKEASDALFEEFLSLNPWAREAQQSFGARGGNVWCRMKLPPSQENCRVLERVDSQGKPEKAGEFRAGKCVTIISGAHPSGALYRIKNPGNLPLIRVEDVYWPDGVRLRQKALRQAEVYDDTPGEISLDLSKIEGLRDHPRHSGALEGRCPVCASNRKDHKCDHLAVWPSGAFNCIAGCDTSEIFALAGRRRGWRGKAKNGTARGSGHRRFSSTPVKYDLNTSTDQ